jgi:GTPase involved in cell partitioning and DNA repair
VVIRRVLDYDEQWDEASRTIRKLHQETDDDESAADFDHDTTATHQYDSQSRKDGEDNFDTTANHQAPHLGSSIDDHISDSGSSEDLDIRFTPWGEREKVEIADLDTHGSYVVVAKGGRGGTGSSIFASRHGPLPSPEVIATYGKPEDGEATFLELELKLIADIGLIGFPNAGKSSLLAAMSRATPHIAPYPFTTLNPLVGYIEYTDGFRVCVADVPGLIQGASEGRGKGHDFLRHLERTKALIFVSFRKKIAKLRFLVTS